MCFSLVVAAQALGRVCVIIYLDSDVHHYVLTTTESWQNFG